MTQTCTRQMFDPPRHFKFSHNTEFRMESSDHDAGLQLDALLQQVRQLEEQLASPPGSSMAVDSLPPARRTSTTTSGSMMREDVPAVYVSPQEREQWAMTSWDQGWVVPSFFEVFGNLPLSNLKTHLPDPPYLP